APVSGLGTTALFTVIPSVIGQYLDPSGSYSFGQIAPGSYALSLLANGCGTDASLLGSTTATVAAGSAATADFDITAVAGRLTGQITLNGTPLPFPTIAVSGVCAPSPSQTSDGLGNFSMFLQPGSYTADVFSNSSRVGSFTFTVVAGQETALATVDLPTGSLA